MEIVSASRRSRGDHCTHPAFVYLSLGWDQWHKPVVLRAVHLLVASRESGQYLSGLAYYKFSRLGQLTVNRAITIQHLEHRTSISEHDVEERFSTDIKVLGKDSISHVLGPV